MMRAGSGFAVLAIGLLPSVGCWTTVERGMMERADTMEGHLTSLFDATRALEKHDPIAYKKAMHHLEHGGELPGVVAAADLDLLHLLAKKAAKAKTTEERQSAWLMMAQHCGECHTRHGISTPPTLEASTALEHAMVAFVWRDEAIWNQARSELKINTEAPDWTTRGESLFHP